MNIGSDFVKILGFRYKYQPRAIFLFFRTFSLLCDSKIFSPKVLENCIKFGYATLYNFTDKLRRRKRKHVRTCRIYERIIVVCSIPDVEIMSSAHVTLVILVFDGNVDIVHIKVVQYFQRSCQVSSASIANL